MHCWSLSLLIMISIIMVTNVHMCMWIYVWPWYAMIVLSFHVSAVADALVEEYTSCFRKKKTWITAINDCYHIICTIIWHHLISYTVMVTYGHCTHQIASWRTAVVSRSLPNSTSHGIRVEAQCCHEPVACELLAAVLGQPAGHVCWATVGPTCRNQRITAYRLPTNIG